jgi:hypothetical protein
MTSEVWMILGVGSFLALAGLTFLWQRMTVFRWYCRRCKKIVSTGRFHPGKCQCGGNLLVAYFCKACASWNTSPTSNWHCSACSSKNVSIGVEYHNNTAWWRWRNQRA